MEKDVKRRHEELLTATIVSGFIAANQGLSTKQVLEHSKVLIAYIKDNS